MPSAISNYQSPEQMHEAIKKRLEMLTTLLDAMPDLVCLKDGENRWLYANPYDRRLFQLEHVDYFGKKDSELGAYSPFYQEAFLDCEQSDEAAWQKGSTLRTIEVIPKPDGNDLTFDIIKIPLFHEDGSRKGLVVLGRDITAQKKYEAELQKLNDIFSQAQKVAKVGHWLWDIKTGALEWSDEVFRIFGYEPQSFTPTYARFMESVFEEDIKCIEDAIAMSLQNNRNYRVEHRIKLPDGSIKTVLEESAVIYDQHDVPAQMLGVVLDITDIKTVEAQLNLATQILENSIEGVVITDENACILMVNKAFESITGYSQEEALGKTPNILKSDMQDRAFYEKMWQSLKTDNKWSGEIWNRRKTGEVYPEWLTIIGVRDETGKTTRYISIFHDLTEVKTHQAEARHKEFFDPLTGLANRKMFMATVESAIKNQTNGNQLCLAYLDLDDFKKINEGLGHLAGDALLKMAAARIQAITNRSKNMAARLGGDEFAILLELEDDEDILEKSASIIQEILTVTAAPFFYQKEKIQLTASIGISLFPNDGIEPNKLFTNAELAMYEAKKTGNTYHYFQKGLDEKARTRLALENKLRQAIELGTAILPYYQPKVDAKTGAIVGMEALVRWRSSDGKMISPADFIPLAEDTGLIIELGELMLKKAMLDTKKWLEMGITTSVAVNLSPRQFKDKKLVDRIIASIKEADFPSHRLELEITESAVLEQEMEGIQILSQFRNLGISITMDDFGTGYSSLYYLKKLPIQSIKIDKSFVDDLPENHESAAIAKAIIAISKTLGLKVVAEGVETQSQLDFLIQNDCDQIQGYFFSPPVPAEKMQRLLLESQKITKS